jgi:hypothetical protein
MGPNRTVFRGRKITDLIAASHSFLAEVARWPSGWHVAKVRLRPEIDIDVEYFIGGEQRRSVALKNVWRLTYGMLFVLCLLGGADVFGREDFSRTNTDWYAVSACLLVSLMFPSLMLWQANSSGVIPVPAPSFDRRLYGGFRRDPLQWVRIGTLLSFGSLVGRLIILRGANEGQPFMAACIMGSFAIGFGAGEFICRRVFARFISAHLSA